MAINKKYKQGAEDVGNFAGKALDKVAGRIEDSISGLQDWFKKQGEINNAVFDVLDDDDKRIRLLQIGYKPIDMKAIYALSPDIKSRMVQLIANIPCSGQSGKYKSLILSRLGVPPLPPDKFLPLSGDAAEASAIFLFKLAAVDDAETAENAIDSALDTLIISRDDLKRIARQISELKNSLNDNFFDFLIRELDDPESFNNPVIKRKRIHHKIKGIVIGKTGSGKSTLLHSIFEFEEVKPQTQRIGSYELTLYSDTNDMVTFYDTPGFKLGDQRTLLQNIIKMVNDKTINVLLYCVSLTSRRFEDFEAEIIRTLRNENSNLAVYIILTQCLKQNSEEIDKMVDYIHSKTNHTAVIPILAQEVETDFGTIPAFGVRELIEEVAYD